MPMTYLDIFSEAISHFTNIPKEFVVGYLKRYVETNDKDSELLDYILGIEFPEIEGAILLNDLKCGDLNTVISFFQKSFKVIKDEEQRQALVN